MVTPSLPSRELTLTLGAVHPPLHACASEARGIAPTLWGSEACADPTGWEWVPWLLPGDSAWLSAGVKLAHLPGPQ